MYVVDTWQIVADANQEDHDMLSNCVLLYVASDGRPLQQGFALLSAF